MPEELYSSLVKLCYVQSHSKNEKRMVVYLLEQLKKLKIKNYDIDAVGNIVVTKGHAKTYPCVVSHMDTVHKIVNDYKIFSEKIEQDEIKLYAKSNKQPTGIGGDDKSGIFSCLYFLNTLPAVKVVFFTQEEIGCNGSDDIDKSFFDDVRYIIQLDRRGAHDCIDKKYQEPTVSHSFLSEIGILKKKYGFKSAIGTMTDSINLYNQGIGVSCLNISGGYYNPHTANEYILVNELWNSILFVQDIIRTLKAKRYTHKKPEVKIVKYTDIKVFCSSCSKLKAKSLGLYKNNRFICYKCWNKQNNNKWLDSKIGVCDICRKRTSERKLTFLPDINRILCPECLTKHNETTYLECDWCKGMFKETEGQKNIHGLDFVCNDCIIDNHTSEFDSCKCDICGKIVDSAEELTAVNKDTYACVSCFVNKKFKPDKKPKKPKNSHLECEQCHNIVSIDNITYDFDDGLFKCQKCYPKGKQ